MSWFSNLKVSRKLTLGAAIQVSPFILALGLCIAAFDRATDSEERMYHREFAIMRNSQEMRIHVSLTSAALGAALLGDATEEELKAVEENIGELSEHTQNIEAIKPTGEQGELFEQFKQSRTAWQALALAIREEAKAGHQALAMGKLNECEQLRQSLDAVLDKLIISGEKASDAANEAVLASTSHAKMIGVIGSALALLCALVVVVLVTRTLTAPLSKIRDVLQQVGSGDFTQRVDANTRDEFGEMSRGIDEMIGSMSKALNEVRSVARGVAASSGELQGSSQEISSGAQEQASGLEETAASLEEITSTIRQNSDNAQQASQLATSSRSVAEKGRGIVESAVQAMKDLSESSRQIADIITTIDEIAFQTNLLALNAAVEAARAGEQGRGFAVVANEVRNLAQRSAQAAREIKALIQTSLSRVDAGVGLVNESDKSLEEIVSSVKRVTDIVGEIASASREQAVGIDQVNKAVSQMDQVTQRNAGQTEELTATANVLSTAAKQLDQLVGRFRLSATEAKTFTALPSAEPLAAPRPSLAPTQRAAHDEAPAPAPHAKPPSNEDWENFTEL